MSNTQEVTLQQLEEIRQECNKAIDMAKALDRLQNNPDFKMVFVDKYIREDSERLVGLLSEQTFNLGGKKAEFREDIHERMIGIASFSEYMRNIYKLADQAQNSLNNAAEAEKDYYEAQ